MKKRKNHGEFKEFILLILLNEGKLNLAKLEEKISLFISYFSLSASHFVAEVFEKLPLPIRKKDFFKKEIFDKRHKDYKKIDSVKNQCEELVEEGFVIKNTDNEYELTEKGKYRAEYFKKDLEKGASVFESQFRSPEAATKNTFLVNIFLTIIKLTAGFLSGSVGLIADGADACIDTASAATVWLGMRFKKELFGVAVIILMMFVTGIGVGLESISKLVQIFSGAIGPITHPLLVIFVEIVAMIFAALLTFYQRYVGKSHGSFALISQSVDSKNHIFVAGAVILGAILSVSGLHFVDAFIGAYISYRILKDAFGLTKEALATVKGKEGNLDKYKYPLEEQWHLSKLESFRLWVLYTIRENKIKSREKIIKNLKETFNPEYMPVISEFKFSLGKGFDFREKFNNLIKPLLEKNLIVENSGEFSLTKEGERYLDKKFHLIRYHERK
jgi:Co/Zn/Cd efflux system component/predicted transcriptional regulator